MVPQVDPLPDAASRLPRSRAFPLLRQGLGAVVMIAALASFAQTARVAEPARQAAPADPASVPAFVPSASLVARPAVPVSASGPRFRLEESDSIDPVRSEPSRIDPSTGQREDTLSQGDFGTIEGPYLRMIVAEGSDANPPRNLFVTLARRGADGLGLSILKTGERGRLDTKFGPVETLDVTLSGPNIRTCTGFMTLRPAPLRIDGWLCAPLGQPPEPRAVACALDKLVLNGQASSDLEALIRAAETQRDRGCASTAAIPLRDVASQTGSIQKRRGRKNKAELGRGAQAQP